MTRPTETDNLTQLYEVLMPALAKAAVGDFSSEIGIDASNDRRVNELLVGVQVLLDVINEKAGELEKAKTKQVQARDRSGTLIDEILKDAR
jgi:hypothetical protein